MRRLKFLLVIFAIDCLLLASTFRNNLAARLGFKGYTRESYRWPD